LAVAAAAAAAIYNDMCIFTERDIMSSSTQVVVVNYHELINTLPKLVQAVQTYAGTHTSIFE